MHTPNMDRLASEGVRLNNCFATVPVCSPNRATMLSGTYPTTNLMLCNDFPLKTDLPSLGTVAKANGAATGYIGKWHLDGVPRSKFTPPGPRRWGFDFWAAYNCTHTYMEPKYYRDEPEVIRGRGYEPEVQTDLALGFLEERKGTAGPFCLVVSWGPPHDPYPQVPEKYLRMYDPAEITLRPNVQEGGDNPLAAGKDCRRTIAQYYAAVTALDEQLGRILDHLEAVGLAEDTIVVFTSDHGDMLWSNGWMKKQAPFDEAISVPFIVRWPEELPSGECHNVLMGSVDILPTLCSLLDWPVPESAEGADLSDILRNIPGTTPSPESVFIANYISADEGQRQNMPEWRGVRTDRYTYAELPGRSPWLLFDNREDPFQLTNLIENPVSQSVVEELRNKLAGWLGKTRDPFLPRDELLAYFGMKQAFGDRKHMYD